MNDNRVYYMQSYEKIKSHDYYCQIMIHEICDDGININLTLHKIEIKSDLKTIKAKEFTY